MEFRIMRFFTGRGYFTMAESGPGEDLREKQTSRFALRYSILILYSGSLKCLKRIRPYIACKNRFDAFACNGLG